MRRRDRRLTGKTKWYYQTVPHDVWDLDAVSPPVVTTVGGQKVVVHAGKTGWVYVLDAATGKLVRRSDAFVPQENMFALPTGRGHADAAGRQRRCGVVADRDRPDARLRLRRRAAPADALQDAQRAVGEGPALARLRLRRHPGRRAVRPLLRRRPEDRQDRLAEEGAAADDGRRARRPRAASPSPAKATATSTPTIPRRASCCGSSTRAPAATPPR